MRDADNNNGADAAKAIVVEAFARHRIHIPDNDPMLAFGTVVELSILRGSEVLDESTQRAVARIESAASQWVETAKAELVMGAESAAIGVRRELQSDINSASVKAKDAVLMALSANTGAMRFKWIATGCALCLGSTVLGMFLMLLLMRYMHTP
jgi:hypothetical protein